MGIESDQLVYDYLSRVGDLAQQAQLPSGDRMRLVTSLRGEIEKQRSRTGGGSPAGVRRILGRLGTPAEVVASAAETATDRGTATATPVGWSTGSGASTGDRDAGPAPGVPLPDPGAEGPGPDRTGTGADPGAARTGPAASAPEPRPAATAPADSPAGSAPAGPGPAGEGPDGPPTRPRGRLRIPRPRPRDKQAPALDAPAAPAGASPPHLAGMDELGPAAARPDWWRTETGPFGAGERVGGFVGGIEVPEILRPPPEEDDRAPGTGTGDEDADAGDGTGTEAAPAHRRLRARLPRVLRRAGPPEVVEAEPVVAATPARVRLANPLLLLAAALLLTGAVLGSLLPLAGGWLIAYGSRRLTAGQSKTAVLYLPGAAVAGGLVWLWGRVNGRWGEPIPQDGMREVLTGTWPWVLKGAAVATALYLLWRARTATRVR